MKIHKAAHVRITSIANHAFAELPIESLIIPEGVAVIRQYAFYNNRLLTDITLPTTLTTIESFGLYGGAWYQITLPVNLQTMGTYANITTYLG